MKFKLGDLVHWISPAEKTKICRTGNIIFEIPSDMPTNVAVQQWKGDRIRKVRNYTCKNLVGDRQLGDPGVLILIIPSFESGRECKLYAPDMALLQEDWVKV